MGTESGTMLRTGQPASSLHGDNFV